MLVNKNIEHSLYSDVKQIIEKGKLSAAIADNVSLTSTYWYIGKRINKDILKNKRAVYG